MGSVRVGVILVLSCSVILGTEAAPYSPSGGDGVGDNQGEIPSHPLVIDDSFYQEFPKMVDPSSKSKFLEHVDDMVFIKEGIDKPRNKRNAVLRQDYLWPGGIVPYEISPSYDDFEKRIILQAMAHWEENTCLRFRPKNSRDYYSVYVNNTRPFDCSSFVGRIPFRFRRKQVISLGDRCVYFSTAVHELGHAIGLYHEHNRNDRDDYLTVRPEFSRYPSQIQKQTRTNTLGIGYDYASIMHYDGSRALASKIAAPVGSAEELSPLDIAKVNKLYGCGDCKNRPPLSTVVPALKAPSGSCGQLIKATQSGSFTFPTFAANTKCNFVIAAPEGFSVEYHVRLLGGSTLDTSRNCDNSYIAFYDGASVVSSRIYNYSPKPRFCTSNEFRFTFILPNNVTTISYQSGSSGSKSVRVNYYVNDVNECRRARSCKSCVNTRGSYECTCNAGFYLSHPAKTCYDINECAFDNGGCQHTCTNTAGSYSCSCRSGYYLQGDGKSCGRSRPSSAPWSVVPGTLNKNTCPVSFSVINQPPVVTTTKPSVATTAKPPAPTPSPTDIKVISSSTINNYNTLFSTIGWPNQAYQLNKYSEWQLKCPDGTDYIDVKFEENFLVAGKMPQCTKDQVYVYSNGIKVGGPYCHTTAPQPLQSLSATNTKVTFISGSQRGTTRTGFGVRFQCRGSLPTTEKPTTPQSTLPPTTTMTPTTPRPTTSPPTTLKPTTAAPTTMMATTQSQTTSLPASVGPCGPEDITATTRNNFNTAFGTPGWPDEPYPLNVNCEWRLHCPSSSDLIDIQFEENFKIAGKMPDCSKDYVNVYSKESKVGGPFCHVTAPENIESLNANGVRVTLFSGGGRGPTRTGFTARFRCRATRSPTTLPPTTQPTTPPPTTSQTPTTAEPTTPSPTTPNIPTTSRPRSPCGGVVVVPNRNAYYSFSSTGWPDQPYPLNTNCEWLLICPSPSRFIDIRFDDNFKVAGKMPDCAKDKVYVESSGTRRGPFCHTTRPDPITGLDASSTKVSFLVGGSRGITRTGFSVQFQCRQ